MTWRAMVIFGGVRYASRTNAEWECGAVFDDLELEEIEQQPILHETPGLRAVEELFGLHVF